MIGGKLGTMTAVPAPLASLPEPPYYAVIFASIAADDSGGYADTAARMEQLAAGQPGYLGIESARSDLGITVSYWTDEAAIAAWKAEAEHVLARETGRARWYEAYTLRVAKVERAYGWSR